MRLTSPQTPKGRIQEEGGVAIRTAVDSWSPIRLIFAGVQFVPGPIDRQIDAGL